MVFHLFERLIGNNGDPKSFLKSNTLQHYVEAGFT